MSAELSRRLARDATSAQVRWIASTLLYQGVVPQMPGIDYNKLPWQPGLLTLVR